MREKKKVTISINPPPEDGRCECCGKHISELNSYGGPGDPLKGDFTGAKLIKIYRTMAPEGSHSYDISDCLDKDENLDEDKFIEKYSEKDLEKFWFAQQLMDTVEASWECRDCVILGEKDYFKKRSER